MSTCTGGCVRNVINLGNSIIGVSILAMPYCFQKCGILLSLLLILASGLLTRASCHLLLKAAIVARRRNFEFLAFHTFGSTGKFAVEVGIIGFLLGSCIAFFVVIGDLGPPLVADLLLMKNNPRLRVELLLFLGFMVGLPLGLLRKVDSLTSFSAISVCFYLCLMLKIFSEAFPNLASDSLWANVIWWRPEGIMSALPIFAMALSCQTQLFEIFDTLNDPSLKRMDTVVSGAVHMCTVVYSTVGLFGYIAFFNKGISGNVLLSLPGTALSKFVKLGFILTVVISFPLCLFPCRTSLHSLLYRPGMGHHDHHPVNLIPDHRFRCLTTALVAVTVGTSIMLPNIELVLGIVGSTIGATICFILPALVFIRITTKNTNERVVAQLILSLGIFILVACTYATLRDANQPATLPPTVATTVAMKNPPKLDVITPAPDIVQKVSLKPVEKVPVTFKPSMAPPAVILEKKVDMIIPEKEVHEEKRQEPPVPQEPEDSKPSPVEINVDKLPEPKLPEQDNVLDPDALKKEDKEMEVQKERKAVDVVPNASEKKDDAVVQRQDELLKKLEAQQVEQKKIIEEQKKLLEELRQHKESHDPKQEGEKEQPIKEEIPKQDNAKVQLKEPHEHHQPSDIKHMDGISVPKQMVSKVESLSNRNEPEVKRNPPEAQLPQFLPNVEPKMVPNPHAFISSAIPNAPKPESPPRDVMPVPNNIPLAVKAAPVANRQQQIVAANIVNNYITGNKGANVSKNKENQGMIQDQIVPNKNEMRKLLQDDLPDKNATNSVSVTN